MAEVCAFQNIPRMIKFRSLRKALQMLIFVSAIFVMFARCSDEEMIPDYRQTGLDTVNVDSALLKSCKGCNYVVPAGKKVVDGKLLGLKPGSVIGLSSTIIYGSLEFRNIIGTVQQPITIRNCGGREVKIVATDPWHAIKTKNSKHFRITGGTTPGSYGIQIQGSEMGLKLDGLSTDFEIDHIEVSNVSFAGIMAKTDPTCDDATIRGRFTMNNVSLHDNYIHHTGGEGFYVGNSFWDGMDKPCGKRLPHEIKGLKIYNNRVENTGWDGIQVGCAIARTEIFNNVIKNYGRANIKYQNNGMQIGSGTGGLVYNNLIKDGPGNGMIMMGTGDNIVHNNIIVNSGANGIFCDERYTPGEGFKFINNTILNPGNDGIRIFAERVPMNTIVNNIIANPGSFGIYNDSTRSSNDAFIYRMTPEVKISSSHNLFVVSVKEMKFVDPGKDNYRLQPNSPAINFGKDISRFKIKKDFYHSSRLRGFSYDAGASEF